MTENRTFQFYGIGLGDTPVTVTATVGGTQIFSGPVTTEPGTLSTEYSVLPDSAFETVMFSLSNSAVFNTDFAGNVPMTMEISGGNGVIITEINSNYYQGNVTTDPNAGTANNFASAYWGKPINSESTPDPRSSVYINGVQQVPPLPASLGTWCWQVPSPATIEYIWNIGIGQIGNVPGATGNYVP